MKNREKLFSVTLKDCDVQYYKGSGAGGQKRNKTESAVRVVHKDSGASGSCESYREQSKNKKEAFLRMTKTDTFQKWMKLEASRAMGELDLIEKKVDQEMRNIKIEIKDEQGKWVKENPVEK